MILLWPIKIYYRDGKALMNTSKTVISQEGNECTLKIPKFSKAEEGLYKCIATNPLGTAECDAKASLVG